MKSGNNEIPADIRLERERFESFLRESGLKLTPQRAAIFDVVFKYHGHLDADEIAGRLRQLGKKASRATVYRTLDLLVEAELVKSVRLGTNQHYYEHVHTGEHHDHLVCLECSKVIEFYSEEIESCQLKICEEHEFTPQKFRMAIFGLCSECSKKKEK